MWKTAWKLIPKWMLTRKMVTQRLNIWPQYLPASKRISSSILFKCMTESESESHPVISDSLQPHGLYSLWNSPGQNTGVGSLSLLHGIFPTQGSNPGLLHWRWVVYQLSHKGSPREIILEFRDQRELHQEEMKIELVELRKNGRKTKIST